MSALFIGSSSISRTVSIETTDRCSMRNNGALLSEPLAAIGVWATRPQPSCVAAKEGDSPTAILCCCKGGRVALPPLPSSLSGHDPFLLPHAQGFELLGGLLTPPPVRGRTRRARVQNTPDLHVDIFQGHLRTAFRERADANHPLGLQRRN